MEAKPQEHGQDSFMSRWEMGSPMRSFIYYLQRATCGALTYLVVHQMVLGLRMLRIDGWLAIWAEELLAFFSLPGHLVCITFFDPIRPLNLPPALAYFFVNILFYFFTVWIACYLYNLITDQTFVGKKRDPFQLKPQE